MQALEQSWLWRETNFADCDDRYQIDIEKNQKKITKKQKLFFLSIGEAPHQICLKL